MAINSMHNKFGLPKPDFQALPKKKVIWPLLVIVAIVIVLIATKISYNFDFKIIRNSTPSTETVNSCLTADQLTDASSLCSSTPSTGKRIHVNRAATHSSICDAETFEHKKRNKIKRSISSTQKQLAAKQSKPLVKPGTYQQLKEPQGIYHLVVVSYLDKRSAMQMVQQLMKKNLGVCLILPRINKGEKYHRVTIGHSKTRYEADQKLEQFKATYKDIFILKY